MYGETTGQQYLSFETRKPVAIICLFWQIVFEEVFNGGAKNLMNELPTEFITVEGEQRQVRKRYQHSSANKFAAASYWVSSMHAYG